MESLQEISNKLIKCSHNDKLEILISVRAFLFDNPEIGGLIFTSCSNYDEVINNFIKKSNKTIRFLNEKNIKKLQIKSQDLFLLPKNKKISLINLVDSLVEEYDVEVVYDKIRADPFSQDDLLIFITNNKNNFSQELINIFNKRSSELIKITQYANIEEQINETCFTISRKNKIKNYWINIWGLSETYLNPGIIENLLL